MPDAESSDAKGVHHEAAGRFHDLALQLVSSVERLDVAKSARRAPPQTERPIAATITGDMIIGDIIESTIDHSGKAIDFAFRWNGGSYCLRGKSFDSFLDLAGRIRSQPPFRDVLSLDFVIEELRNWIRRSVTIEGPQEPIIAYIGRCAHAAVFEYSQWIPLSNFEVARPFQVCGAMVQTITKDIISAWVDRLGDDDEAASKKKIGADLTQKFQGYAAVVHTVKGEQVHAVDQGVERAWLVCQLLAFLSPACVDSQICFFVAPRGAEQSNQRTALSDRSGNLRWITQQRNSSWGSYVKLNSEQIEMLRKMGIDQLSALLTKSRKSQFEHDLSSAIVLFSKAAYTENSVEKAVFALSSLESLILKDGSEPIQHNLAERMAFYLKAKSNDRRTLVALVRRVYALRSQFLHHGQEKREVDDINLFLVEGRSVLLKACFEASRFKTRLDFIEAIENVKFG